MSSPATIVIMNEQGESVMWIYKHFDGHPDCTGQLILDILESDAAPMSFPTVKLKNAVEMGMLRAYVGVTGEAPRGPVGKVKGQECRDAVMWIAAMLVTVGGAHIESQNQADGCESDFDYVIAFQESGPPKVTIVMDGEGVELDAEFIKNYQLYGAPWGDDEGEGGEEPLNSDPSYTCLGNCDYYPGKGIGDIVRVHVGAPGTGYWDYRITEKRDVEGGFEWWGVEVDDTVRELNPNEVR